MTGSADASTAIDPALAARFADALDRLNPGGERIGLAVSGGPDSMAMLLLAHAAIPGRFEVATVDHGLRPEAKAECALVERLCAGLGIACGVLRVEVGDGNLQARARHARYGALTRWAEERQLSAVATAHHADDQAETLLMRLNRGSGVAGLAGVREAYRTENLATRIVRPLLGFRRAELAALVAAAAIEVARDPSNEDERFDRVRIRKELAAADWLDPLALARSALHLAEANEALDFVADSHWRQHALVGEDEVRVRPHAARIIRLRLIERGIRELGGDPRGSEVARLAGSLEFGSQANLAGVLVTVMEEEDGLYLVFSPEPPRQTG